MYKLQATYLFSPWWWFGSSFLLAFLGGHPEKEKRKEYVKLRV